MAKWLDNRPEFTGSNLTMSLGRGIPKTVTLLAGATLLGIQHQRLDWGMFPMTDWYYVLWVYLYSMPQNQEISSCPMYAGSAGFAKITSIWTINATCIMYSIDYSRTKEELLLWPTEDRPRDLRAQ